MGRSTTGDSTIVLKNNIDALTVFSMIDNIEKVVSDRLKTSCSFCISGLHTDDNVVYFNISSSRIINGEFQVNEIIKELKLLVTKGDIDSPESFEAELLVRHEAWQLNEENFY